MAHELEIKNGKASMAYAGQKPWHGLGVEVDPKSSPKQILDAAGLAWRVEKRPIFVMDAASKPVAVDGWYGLTRDSDDRVLTLVGEQYKPVQNEDAFEFFNKFVSAGAMTMETAGSLKGGRHVWALARINYDFELPGKDLVRGFVLMSSPHIHGKGMTIKHTSVRAVCNNTVTQALSGPGASFRMPHVREFDDRMKTVAEQVMGLGKDVSERFEDQATLLASKKASRAKVKEFLFRVFDPASLADKKPIEKAKATMRTVWDAVDNNPGCELEAARGTWWGALNVVTYATDHLLGRTADTRMSNAWFGQRERTKRVALELALDYAKKG